ncbi:MAG: ABC transporter permease [Acidobacteria bacterium]|nr:ABC transporter permease [Acidobacteriota bacterium]
MISPNTGRYAIRSLRKGPGFAGASILILALGIGITGAIFSVVYGVLLQSLPYGQPDRLCLLWKSIPKKNIDRDWTSYPTYQDWKRDGRGFEDLAAFLRPDGSVVNLAENDNVEQIQSAKVSANFFSVLSRSPLLGRTFTPSDISANTNLAVLSYDFWRRHFGSSRDVIGKNLVIDDAAFQVIGVMPSKFAFPAKDSQVWSPAKDTQLWLPINSDPRWPKFQTIRLADAFGVVGRLKPKVSPEQAQVEMSMVSRRLAREHADTDLDLGIRVIPLSGYLVGARLRLTLWLFLSAVVVVLLIACTNVAGLFVSRTCSRRKYYAIQIALGAGRSHILWQLFAEAVVLALAAGTIGVGLAALGVKGLTLAAPSNVPGLENVSLNALVLAFTFLISLFSAVISVLGPGWKLSVSDPQSALKEKFESGSGHGNGMYSFLVFIEFALAIVLLAATGLLLRSALRLQKVDLGFRPDHLVSMNISLHGEKYAADSQIRVFVDEAIRRVSAIPGVRSAAIGSIFLSRLPNSQLEIEGRPAAASVIDDEPATWTYVSEGFFETLGIPLLRGRFFSLSDGPVGLPVVIVNQVMARRLWPGQDPIGKRFKYNVPGYKAKDWLTVVGVVGDTVQNGPETHPISLIYYPVRQKVWDVLGLMVRTDADPTAVEMAVGKQIHLLDQTIPQAEVSTVEQQLWDMGSARRFQIELFTLFSLLATILAAVGIYGVMAYAVGQRTREIGVRVALGARRRDILVLVLGQGLAPALLGLLVGLVLALALTRTLSGLLYGVAPTDSVTYLSVCTLLFAIAGIAAYRPARRAMRVDPVIALRSE